MPDWADEKARALCQMPRHSSPMGCKTCRDVSAALREAREQGAREERDKAAAEALTLHHQCYEAEIKAEWLKEERDAALKHLRAALSVYAGGTPKEQRNAFIEIERFLGVGRG